MTSIESLHRSYGEVEAVRGVSFSVDPGEVFGLLGSNGAGKTTIDETLGGLPAGSAIISGRPWSPPRSPSP